MIEKASSNKKISKPDNYEEEILVRRVYKSFKGELVMIFGIAIIESRDSNLDGKEMIIYTNLNSGEMKLREKSTWFEKNPTTGVPRYILGDVSLGNTI